MMDWSSVVSVGIGGALGSIMRYAVAVWTVQRFGPGFPLGTFTVNVIGSFLIGTIAELSITGDLGVTREVRTFVAVGVLGGFTTFSSFSNDTLVLVRDGATQLAVGYVAATVILGLLAAYAGTVAARLIVAH